MAFQIPLTQAQDYDPVPSGLQKGVCVGVFMLGTIPSDQFGPKRRVLFKWELPDVPPLEFEKDGEPQIMPRVLTREYTCSMHPKGLLRPMIEGWLGATLSDAEANGFNAASMIGRECTIQVIHVQKDDKIRANIKAIMPLMSPIEYQVQSEPVLFDVDEHIGPDGSFLVEIPEWIQKKVMTSEEYKAKTKLPSNRELGHQPAQRQPAPQQRQAPAPAQAARPVARPQAAAPRPPQQLHRGQPMQQPARRQPQPPPPDPEDDGRLPEPPDDVPM